jgi:hypothetical protein
VHIKINGTPVKRTPRFSNTSAGKFTDQHRTFSNLLQSFSPFRSHWRTKHLLWHSVVTVTQLYAQLQQCSFAGHASRQREPLEKNGDGNLIGEGISTSQKSDRGGPDNYWTVATKNALTRGAEGLPFYLVRPERFELPTAWFEARNSVQLSYGRKLGG